MYCIYSSTCSMQNSMTVQQEFPPFNNLTQLRQIVYGVDINFYIIVYDVTACFICSNCCLVLSFQSYTLYPRYHTQLTVQSFLLFQSCSVVLMPYCLALEVSTERGCLRQTSTSYPGAIGYMSLEVSSLLFLLWRYSLIG